MKAAIPPPPPLDVGVVVELGLVSVVLVDTVGETVVALGTIFGVLSSLVDCLAKKRCLSSSNLFSLSSFALVCCCMKAAIPPPPPLDVGVVVELGLVSLRGGEIFLKARKLEPDSLGESGAT